MKLIDILIEISKEHAPVSFSFDGKIWELKEDGLYYTKNLLSLEEYCNITKCLNEEAQIRDGGRNV